MGVLAVLRWPVKASVGLTVTAFVAFSVVQAVNTVSLSSLFQALGEVLWFPFIREALKDSEEEQVLSFLSRSRRYVVAVRT
jgi:hypothetical protein